MTVMRAMDDVACGSVLRQSEASRREAGLEAPRASSNAALAQKCLTLKGLRLRGGRSGVSSGQQGAEPGTARAALETPARSHNHGAPEFFSTLLM